MTIAGGARRRHHGRLELDRFGVAHPDQSAAGGPQRHPRGARASRSTPRTRVRRRGAARRALRSSGRSRCRAPSTGARWPRSGGRRAARRRSRSRAADDTSCGCSVATAAGSSTTMTSRGNVTPRHALSSRPSSSARRHRRRALGQVRVGHVVVHHDVRERRARSERRPAGEVEQGERDRVGREAGCEADHQAPQQLALAGARAFRR